MLKAIALLFGFLILVSNVSFAAEKAPARVRLGFIPGEGPEELRKRSNELGALLSKKVGVPFQVVIPDTYSQLVEKMKKKEVDMAFLTAMTFVVAEKEAGAKVLLKKVWQEPYYHSVILTRSDLKSLEDLKGKSIGFVDEKSTSGYLYPKVMLKKRGWEKDFFSKITMTGNHRESVLQLAAGKLDAVAVFSDDSKGEKSAWQKYAPLGASSPQVLWVSEPIPNDPFCVRNDFYDKYPRLTHDVMFALIELRDEPGQSNLLKKLLGVTELMLATSRQYEPVREMVKELNLGGHP